ncbi:hypothetical protein AVEN_35471-1 [Araneus ventricosus]|uniref:Uncharacterized protein n=1 Tax=Araneus ventricosus TaxID=182803 RepID=A0A4Y2V744_ARAVE|nr:hypothetical protein AVEN_35471-1 [Araneus ventricosus]
MERPNFKHSESSCLKPAKSPLGRGSEGRKVLIISFVKAVCFELGENKGPALQKFRGTPNFFILIKLNAHCYANPLKLVLSPTQSGRSTHSEIESRPPQEYSADLLYSESFIRRTLFIIPNYHKQSLRDRSSFKYSQVITEISRMPMLKNL